MAIVRYNSLITGISGELDGLIYYSRNGKRCVRRAWRITKPRSAAQNSRCALFREAAGAWRGMPREEKERWSAMARPMDITGYQAYMRRRLLERPGAGRRGRTGQTGAETGPLHGEAAGPAKRQGAVIIPFPAGARRDGIRRAPLFRSGSPSGTGVVKCGGHTDAWAEAVRRADACPLVPG